MSGIVKKVRRLFSQVHKTIIHSRSYEWLRHHRRVTLGAGAALLLALVLLIVLPIFMSDGRKDKDASAGMLEHRAVLSPADLDHLSATPTPIPTPTPTPAPTPTPDLTLRRGDENERVRLLQERLMTLGYMGLDESTRFFGPVTEQAVKFFQRQHDLDEDGIVGPVTLDLVFSSDAKRYTLLQGTRGTDVDSLQRQLVDLGYMNTATGYYGSKTVDAVKAFQARNGLYVDGKTGEQTLALIYSPNARESATKERAAVRRANIRTFVATAERQLGKRYILGAQGPNSFDCSGLVYYSLREAGSSRRRYNAAGYAQVTDWEKISSMNNLQIGDLLFFKATSSRIDHVGIYIGNGMMIDASSSNGKIVKRSCTTAFWTRSFVYARRPW